jgi:hypothetical protein
MRALVWIVCAIAGLGAAGRPAAAADKGGFGLDVETGVRRLVGVTWHPSARVALRPGVFFQDLEAENTPTLLDPGQEAPVYRTEDIIFGGRLEVDFLLRERRKVTPYFGLTGSYTHLNTPYPVSENSNVLFRTGNLTGLSGGALFGAQYALSEAFQVYGTVGLSYSATERFTLNGRRLHSYTWTTSTSALGLVFYLN